MKVVVVGGGIFAQAVSFRLAARKVEVVQIEEVEPGHEGSQSGDRTRVVRALYGDARFAESGHRSLSMWHAWSETIGEPLIETCGTLYIERDAGTAEDAAFARYVDQGILHLVSMGVPIEIMTPEAIHAAWPAISTEGVVRGVLEPGGGFGRISRATRALAKASEKTGRVKLVKGRVEELWIESGRVRGVVAEVAGAATKIEADKVVVAAGLGGVAIAEKALGTTIGVRPIPHFVAYFSMAAEDAKAHALGSLPVWAELGAGRYGFPDEGAGFKAAWHEPLRKTDDHGDPSAEVLDSLRGELAIRFPAVRRAKLERTVVCTYDATDDEDFVLGWLPGVEGAYFVGGMSGHGFKHAPAIGDSVAAIVADKKPALDLSSFSTRLRAS